MIGTMQVNKPSGMEVLNNSIDTLVNQIPKDEWKMVSVAVAPSTITVSFVDGGEPPLDCRVRFLSFLGIGQQNAQYCAFIVHTSQVNVLMVCG
jgi:amyloid beta (A4) precursor protein-binding family B protein 2 (Fe65-like)